MTAVRSVGYSSSGNRGTVELPSFLGINQLSKDLRISLYIVHMPFTEGQTQLLPMCYQAESILLKRCNSADEKSSRERKWRLLIWSYRSIPLSHCMVELSMFVTIPKCKQMSSCYSIQRILFVLFESIEILIKMLCLTAGTGQFDPLNQTRGPAPPLESKSEDRYYWCSSTVQHALHRVDFVWVGNLRYGVTVTVRNRRHCIQPITAREIISQPIRMLGYGTMMARYGHSTARTVP